MIVANLTKYACFGDGMMCAVKDRVDDIRRYVIFEEAMEASLSSMQHLKAEIAALVEEHSHGSKFCGGNYYLLVNKLRQLSAIPNGSLKLCPACGGNGISNWNECSHCNGDGTAPRCVK